MPEKKSKVNEAISYILETLESIEDRLSELESNSDDFDSIELRISRIESRLGL